MKISNLADTGKRGQTTIAPVRPCHGTGGLALKRAIAAPPNSEVEVLAAANLIATCMVGVAEAECLTILFPILYHTCIPTRNEGQLGLRS